MRKEGRVSGRLWLGSDARAEQYALFLVSLYRLLKIKSTPPVGKATVAGRTVYLFLRQRLFSSY